MNQKDLLLKIGLISSKNDLYYFFKGLLSSLNAENVCASFDIDLNQDSFKKQLFLEKILKDLDIYLDIRTKSYVINKKVNLKNRNIYLPLFEKMLRIIIKTKDYRKNQEYAKFLYRMCPAMPNYLQKKIINYFILSEYRSNQRRALEYLNRNWDESFSYCIVTLWLKNNYEIALRLIVWKIKYAFLDRHVFESINEYFKECQQDDYFDYDYNLKILRNKFYSRFFKKFSSDIEALKFTDPISFIFIKKESGRKIDDEFAIKIYDTNLGARKYLPRWYAEMGMNNVLSVILSGQSGV